MSFGRHFEIDGRLDPEGMSGAEPDSHKQSKFIGWWQIDYRLTECSTIRNT
jgi:hypothetical protein